MSCKTWSELLSLGDSLLMESSPERDLAQRHFEHCPSCAGKAYLLDPSWALRGSRSGRSGRLGESSFGESEISALKRDVLERGRLRQVEVSVEPRRPWLNAAIAVAVLIVIAAGAALLRNGGSLAVVGNSATVVATNEALLTQRRSESLALPGGQIDLSLPTLGSVAPAAARIYDFGQEDFALVMVIHETLDL